MCVEGRFILIATLEIYANPHIVGIFNEASIKRIGFRMSDASSMTVDARRRWKSGFGVKSGNEFLRIKIGE